MFDLVILTAFMLATNPACVDMGKSSYITDEVIYASTNAEIESDVDMYVPIDYDRIEGDVEEDYPWLLHTCGDNDFYMYYASYQMLGYAVDYLYDGKVPCNFTCNLPDDIDREGYCALKGADGTILRCFVNTHDYEIVFKTDNTL